MQKRHMRNKPTCGIEPWNPASAYRTRHHRRRVSGSHQSCRSSGGPILLGASTSSVYLSRPVQGTLPSTFRPAVSSRVYAVGLRTCASPFVLGTRAAACGLLGRRSLMLVALGQPFLRCIPPAISWGMGISLLRKVEADTWHDVSSATQLCDPDPRIASLGPGLLGNRGEHVPNYSYTSGVLYVLIAFPAAAAVWQNALDEIHRSHFLLTTGTMQLFFIRGELRPVHARTPPLSPSGLRDLENRMPMSVPGLVTWACCLRFIQAFIVFGPSTLPRVPYVAPTSAGYRPILEKHGRHRRGHFAASL